MFLAPIVALVIWSDIILIEFIKIMFGMTIGAILIFFRNTILEIIKRMAKFVSTTLVETPKSIAKGIKLLGSEKFQALPSKVDELHQSLDSINQRVARLENSVGPNGGKSILDGINSLKQTATELKEAIATVTARDKEIADAVGVLMWKSDENGNCIWASKSLQDLVGYTFEEGFKGQQWENLFFPEDFENVLRRWTNAIEVSKNNINHKDVDLILSMKTRYRHGKTGRAIPIQFKVSRFPDGSITSIVTDLSIPSNSDEHIDIP